MSDKTGCKKPPNFFPGNSFLHRARLLEPGLFSYTAAKCDVPLSDVRDPIAPSLGGSGKYSGGIGKLEKRKQTTLQIVDLAFSTRFEEKQ